MGYRLKALLIGRVVDQSDASEDEKQLWVRMRNAMTGEDIEAQLDLKTLTPGVRSQMVEGAEFMLTFRRNLQFKFFKRKRFTHRRMLRIFKKIPDFSSLDCFVKADESRKSN